MNTTNNTNNTMSINNNIINALYNKKGNGFVGIVYVADVRMNKRGNPLAEHNVFKCVKTQFNFGIVYENAVANRASKEQGERWNSWLKKPKGTSGNVILIFFVQ